MNGPHRLLQASDEKAECIAALGPQEAAGVEYEGVDQQSNIRRQTGSYEPTYLALIRQS